MHARPVCIFVYVGADRPLPAESGLRIEPVKRRGRQHNDLRDGVENLYLALGGCACELSLDGADGDARRKRDSLLDGFESFLTEATKDGPVEALVTDDDRRAAPGHVSVSVAEFRSFDFDTAWNAPTRLTITRG
jgi:cysteine sulfinate desulfinase/cysteine desulfurase-like protein